MTGNSGMPVGKFRGTKMKNLEGRYLCWYRTYLNGKRKLSQDEIDVWNYIHKNFETLVSKKDREINESVRKNRKLPEIADYK